MSRTRIPAAERVRSGVLQSVTLLIACVLPFTAMALPCPQTLTCPDGATPHGRGETRWCAKNGTGHGPQVECRDGTLVERSTYEDGKLVGLMQTWYPNGARRTIFRIVEGERQGEQQTYHPNNWIAEISQFDHGVLSGEYYRFDDKGRWNAHGTYVQGVREGEWVLRQGGLVSRGEFVADRKDGTWKTFNADGALVRVQNYAAGRSHGPFEVRENGEVVADGKYADGHPDGVWHTYRDGEIQIQDTYDRGMLLERCQSEQKRLQCTTRAPYRRLAVRCATSLKQSQFVESEEEFAADFTHCDREPAIDWGRNRVYVHRDDEDPYALRLSGVERQGPNGVLVFERRPMCSGDGPPPPSARWIVLVVPRSYEQMTMRVEEVPPPPGCDEAP